MDFEWNQAKARRNAAKHGVAFEEAASIFLDPRELSVYDPDHSIAEDRFVSDGVSNRGRLLVVGYTDRGRKIGLIFARHATPTEHLDYDEV